MIPVYSKEDIKQTIERGLGVANAMSLPNLRVTYSKNFMTVKRENIKTDYQRNKTKLIWIWDVGFGQYEADPKFISRNDDELKRQNPILWADTFGYRASKEERLTIPEKEQYKKVSHNVFVDIDHLTDAEKKSVFDAKDEIGRRCPEIIMMQQSTSGNFHFFCIDDRIRTFDGYANSASLYAAHIASVIFELTGIDIRLPDAAGKARLDTHNTDNKQGFGFYNSKVAGYNGIVHTFYVNEYFSNTRISTEEEYRLRTEYKQAWKEEKKPSIDYTVSEYENTGGKLTVTHTPFPKPDLARHTKVDMVASACCRYGIPMGVAMTLCSQFYDGTEYDHRVTGIYERRDLWYKPSYDIVRWISENTGIEIGLKRPTEKIVNDIVPQSQPTKTKERIVMGKDEWMSDYTDTIVDAVKKHNRLMIMGPTGVGKSTALNGQYNRQTLSGRAFRQEEVPSIVSKFNGILIVPFNATRELYPDLFLVDSTYKGKVPADKACVMVFDQAVKHWDEIWYRQIFVDESHEMVLGQDYRQRCIALLSLLSDKRVKVCCISATPTAEEEILDLEHRLEFFKERDNHIRMTMIPTNDVFYCEKETIMTAVEGGYYDRVVVFDDQNNQKLYNDLMMLPGLKGDIALLRASTKDTKDFAEVTENRTLTAKVTLMTRVCFNGINIENQGERILALSSIDINSTAPQEIIQYEGRVRYSKLTAKVFIQHRDTTTVEDKAKKSQLYDRYIRENKLDTIQFDGLYDKRYLEDKTREVLVQLDNWRRSFYSSSETERNAILQFLSGYTKEILEIAKEIENEDERNEYLEYAQDIYQCCKVMVSLMLTKYIDITIGRPWLHEVKCTNGKMQKITERSVYKRECSKLMLRLMREEGDDILFRTFADLEHTTNFLLQWQDQIKRIKTKYDIPVSAIVKVFDLKSKNILVSTVLQEVEERVETMQMTEEEWREQLDTYKKLYDTILDDIEQTKNKEDKAILAEMLSDIRARHNQTLRYRDEYKDILVEDKTQQPKLTIKKMIQMLQDCFKSTQPNISKGNSKGGKKGKPITFKTKDELLKLTDGLNFRARAKLRLHILPLAGKTFQTMNDAAKAAGVTGHHTVSDWLDAGYCATN